MKTITRGFLIWEADQRWILCCQGYFGLEKEWNILPAVII